MSSDRWVTSHGHYVFGLCFDHFVDFLDRVIRKLLDLLVRLLQIILCVLAVFFKLFGFVICIAADISDCNFGILTFFLNIFY